MRVLFGLFLLAAVALAREIQQKQVAVEEPSPYNYHERFGIKEAARIKANEVTGDIASRIIGGADAALGTIPYQAGLVIDLVSKATSVCGASLLSNTKLVTAAHCWFDGSNQARQLTVVLGSTFLFTGGTRIVSNNVVMHANWNPKAFLNDIAMITITWVNYITNIQKIVLPTSLTSQTFDGFQATASGYGKTSDAAGISSSASLKHIWLTVITNAICKKSYGSAVTANNVCTSGVGNIGTCTGDSGGPLAVDISNQRVLIGITSFGAERCQAGVPSVFTRVTSYLSWIQTRL